MAGFHSSATAYVGPFVAFFAIMLLGEGVAGLFEGRLGPWYLTTPRYWVYPLQTLVCGGLIWHWRRKYEMRWLQGWLFGAAIGVVVLLIWIAPQQWLGQAPRLEGFDPGFFASPAANLASIAFRFLRLVVVVPLLEELFWRGFLLRWITDPDFEKVPIGAYTRTAFAVVTVGFALEHHYSDWPAALLAGALYNWVAIRTRSLSACVFSHGLTNLLLGIYVMRTGQWGFW